MLNEALADCSKLAVKPIATAIERGEPRANYACGAVFSLAAEKASRGDFYGFVRNLIAAGRATHSVNSNQWLTALDTTAGNRTLSPPIRKLIFDGSPKPAADLAALLKAAGISYRLDGNGVPQL